MIDIHRTPDANVRLGVTLSFVAGAINAGGFLAVGSYTSHMTGVLSSLADNLVLGHMAPVWLGLASLAAFLGGAMSTAWIVNWCQRRELRSAFARPLLLEALLLLVFGLFGAAIAQQSLFIVPLTVLLLCYIMGLQNAVITKISRAEIRTTHITGLLTDLGIELGKLSYLSSRGSDAKPVQANWRKLRIHVRLVGGFAAGALCGAAGFKTFGYVMTLPLALALLAMVARPLLFDFNTWRAQRP